MGSESNQNTREMRIRLENSYRKNICKHLLIKVAIDVFYLFMVDI